MKVPESGRASAATSERAPLKNKATSEHLTRASARNAAGALTGATFVLVSLVSSQGHGHWMLGRRRLPSVSTPRPVSKAHPMETLRQVDNQSRDHQSG
ncbi:hypothetical protein ACRE_026960 [Hapsidospora chrysogenum ATCC 11550]|uniref:Uncharacterized protein n=1 Tax=Hapsidospora chrysogenum (strain ATCC 11550 / CBS 779.69 / DSM 880 / IAM 14645 / JCM 23072 / IMI 49137) TaxID=857340 RepID=A0A086TAP4_HAPC1|nr:hypothetical protein ACRE_026960 [Hapsidospora chrysogenum ATCC 11550]